jgi:hypothetical protein
MQYVDVTCTYLAQYTVQICSQHGRLLSGFVKISLSFKRVSAPHKVPYLMINSTFLLSDM